MRIPSGKPLHPARPGNRASANLRDWIVDAKVDPDRPELGSRRDAALAAFKQALLSTNERKVLDARMFFQGPMPKGGEVASRLHMSSAAVSRYEASGVKKVMEILIGSVTDPRRPTTTLLGLPAPLMKLRALVFKGEVNIAFSTAAQSPAAARQAFAAAPLTNEERLILHAFVFAPDPIDTIGKGVALTKLTPDEVWDTARRASLKVFKQLLG